MPRLFIIDGNAYIYRAYHAIRDLTTSTGFPTNAIFGFANLLLKILREDRPDYMVVAFDTKEPTFRHKEFAEYKADRPGMPDPLAQQFPLIKEMLSALGLPTLEQPGYEADDVIGTLAKKAENQGMEVIIVTSDKDAFQLVSSRVKIAPHGFRTPYEEGFIFDSEEVKKRFGVEPNKITDLLGLMGDASDNIPGVPGIGEKTASKLLEQFDSIEDLLEHIDNVKEEKRKQLLKQYADQALLSKKLATIDIYVPLQINMEDFRIELLPNGCPTNYDKNKLWELFSKLEFRKFIKELDLSPTGEEKIELEHHTILSESDLKGLISRLKSVSEFAIDTETTSLDPITSDIVGISVSFERDSAYYIPVSHKVASAPPQLPLDLVIKELKPVLEDPSIGKIGQNVKFDMEVLRHYGVELSGVSFDTMLAGYLLNPSSKGGHDLFTMSMELLKYKKTPIEDLIGKGKDQVTMDQVDIEKVSKYSCEDACLTLQLKNLMEPKLKSYGLEEVFRRIELPLIPVLADMEMTGVKLDTEWLSEISRKMAKRLDDLTNEIYALAGEVFNINSTQQLGEILFKKLNLPTGKKTKTGYSTNEAELYRLSKAGHELPSKILEYRSIAKLKSTYVDALPGFINPKTGRVHTSFNQAVTETGRLSSSNPNLQNIPVRTEEGKEIRRAFIPGDEGSWLVTADYSQIELRILAHLSNDAVLISAFGRDEDIHSHTAALIFGRPIDQITPDMRRQAKTINFGVIYGMSAFRLSKELEIPLSSAEQFIDSYFKTYSGVKSYIERTIKFARENGYVTTISGRQRRIQEINSSDKNQREFAERTAVNTPVQGSAADLIKLAMIKIADFFKSEKLRSKLLLQVHDELVFEVPEDELDKVTSNVRSLMESALPLNVPVKVDIGVGKNWLEAK